jgi:hypothetical protein
MACVFKGPKPLGIHRGPTLTGYDADNFILKLLRPHKLPSHITRRLYNVLGAYRAGIVPLLERASRLSMALKIDDSDALRVIIACDEVVSADVFECTAFNDPTLLAYFEEAVEEGSSGITNIKCILGVQRSTCAFGCGEDCLLFVDDSTEPLCWNDERALNIPGGNSVRTQNKVSTLCLQSNKCADDFLILIIGVTAAALHRAWLFLLL